ncbi:expressed unknown protein [Seminavis robusta]|uniref:Fatty acid hydroxylase domain-containing protein n=1 Tax=Seminavis robusta TaxID=568900 RepID=A0A9N8HK23_9STRA|nr:expressed unknown protein [Seminavis robusta]|eukprot:Sro907_g218720.1 n/a (257) ;mRNA; f:2889-3659
MEKEETTNRWDRLESLAAAIQEANPNKGGMISLQALKAEDPEIVEELQATGVQFTTPKTMQEVIVGYLTHGAGWFITSVFAFTCLFRLFLCGTPLGFADLIAIPTARLMWEVQEWAVHSRWFHGEGDGRAMDFFKSHDRHHDLPYYHLSVESLRISAVWFHVVLGISFGAVALGAPAAIVTTCFATYQASALVYSFLHAVCHSHVPVTGYLKECKENHIKHHVSPTHHLNMGPNRIDQLMGTDSYEARNRMQGVIE